MSTVALTALDGETVYEIEADDVIGIDPVPSCISYIPPLSEDTTATWVRVGGVRYLVEGGVTATTAAIAAALTPAGVSEATYQNHTHAAGGLVDSTFQPCQGSTTTPL